MKVTFTNTHATFELGDEPLDLLSIVAKRFAYNDYRLRWERYSRAVLGKVPNYSDPDNIRAFNDFIFRPGQATKFSNYLSMQEERLRGVEYSFKNPVYRQTYSQGATWDGYFRPLRPKGSTLVVPVGAARTVYSFMVKWLKNKSLPVVTEFVDLKSGKMLDYMSIDPVYTVGGKTLRPEQQEVIDLIRKRTMAVSSGGYLFSHYLLDLAVNFGKSLVVTALIHNFKGAYNANLVDSKPLFLKTVADYVEAGIETSYVCAKSDKKVVKLFLEREGLDPNMATYGYGKNCIMMVPTVSRGLKSSSRSDIQRCMERYHLIILDEVDAMANDSTKTVLNHCKPLQKVAMSGTPFESVLWDKRYFVWSQAGQPAIRYTHAKMTALGRSLPLEYRLVNVKKEGFFSWTDAQTFVSQVDIKEMDIYYSEGWRSKICDILTQHQGQSILIYMGSQKIETMEAVAKALRSKGHDVFVTHGKDADRNIKIKQFKEGDIQILLSNVIVSTGLNLPNMDVFVYASLSDSSREFIQALIGRTARRGVGQELGIVYDFLYDKDFGSYHQNSLYRRYYAHRKDLDLKVVDNFQLSES